MNKSSYSVLNDLLNKSTGLNLKAKEEIKKMFYMADTKGKTLMLIKLYDYINQQTKKEEKVRGRCLKG